MERPLSFPKSHRLRKRKEFQAFQKSSRKVGSFLCLDRVPSNSSFSKLGITASRKFGNAVERNRFKRLAREAFRSLAQDLASPLILHVLPRQKAKDASMPSIRKELMSLLQP